MNSCPWAEIESFSSDSEFHRFCEWISEQVESGAAQEIQVDDRFAGATTLNERWFRHNKSGAVWRLVDPDPPFGGAFEAVSLS